MVILGVDPGLASCGYALVELAEHCAVRVHDVGVWRTITGVTLRQRFVEWLRHVGPYVIKAAPRVVVAEVPSFPRSAKSAHMLGLAYGGLRGLCHGRAVFVERLPSEWRRSLGLPAEVDGTTPSKAHRARKKATAEAMHARFPGLAALLKLTPAVQREHAIDALAIACSWIDRAHEERKPL